jgi:hypothetical protein
VGGLEVLDEAADLAHDVVEVAVGGVVAVGAEGLAHVFRDGVQVAVLPLAAASDQPGAGLRGVLRSGRLAGGVRGQDDADALVVEAELPGVGGRLASIG